MRARTREAFGHEPGAAWEMAVLLQGKAQAGIERPSNRTHRTRRRGATRDEGDEVWGRRRTTLRGRGPSRPKKAGKGPCRAWSASHSGVQPPETVVRGVGGRFERPLVKPTTAASSLRWDSLESRWVERWEVLFGGSDTARQRHEGNGCREAVRLSTRGSLRRVQAPTQVGVARRERASTASRSSSGNWCARWARLVRATS
jgi:hypothetical protein